MRYGQSTIEYVFLIGLVAAAIIAASVYFSRGFQGRLRSQADEVGEQYSLRGMDTNTVETSVVRTKTTISDKTTITSTPVPTITNKSGYENVDKPLSQERWEPGY